MLAALPLNAHGLGVGGVAIGGWGAVGGWGGWGAGGVGGGGGWGEGGWNCGRIGPEPEGVVRWW